MVFSAPMFLFAFLPLTLIVWFLSGRCKAILLFASLFFYAWGEPVFISLLIFVILFNYAAGALIAASNGSRTAIFAFAVMVDLTVLALFKYTGFITSNLAGC